MGHHQYLWPRRQVEGCFIMANDLLNLLLCHEEQLKSPHSGGVTLGSISSKQKNAFNNWTEVEKKFFSITFSDSQQLWNFFLESWRDPYFSRQTNCQYSVLLIFQSSRNLEKLNGHTVQMVMTNQWMPFIKRFPLWKKKTPVTNLGCEGTWHLYKLATNWTLVYGHLNLTPGWSFQSIFGHFWTNGHDWISRPGLYLMAGPRNSIRFTLSENPKEWIKNEVF